MIHECGNWVDYRKLPNLMELDFHHETPRYTVDYNQAMYECGQCVISALKHAYDNGYDHILFRHGSSTSRRGVTTQRSVVRSIMRSKQSTPFIIRSKCIQHYSVFVAAIRPNPEGRRRREALFRKKFSALKSKFLKVVSQSPHRDFRQSTHARYKRLKANDINPELYKRLHITLGMYQNHLKRGIGVFDPNNTEMH